MYRCSRQTVAARVETVRTVVLFTLAMIVASALAAGPLDAQRVLSLPPADRALRPTVVDVFRIGGSSARDWAAFDVVEQVAFDAAGNLHVVDRRGARVAIVDRSGRLVRQVGRRGQGPGEFTLIDGIAISREGGFVLLDPLQDRFSIFDADGAFRSAERTTLSPGRLASAPGGVYTTPRVYIVNGERVVSAPDGNYVPPSGLPIYRVPLPRGERPGDTARVVHRAWLPPHVRSTVPFATHAYGPRVHWTAFSDGRLAVVDSVDYAIDIVSPSGVVESVWRRPIAPRAVTGDDRDHARELRRRELIGPDGRVRIGGAGFSSTGPGAPQATPRERVEQAIDAMTFADAIPVIEALAVDWENRLWVRRAPARAGQPSPIDLIGADGAYIGTIAPGTVTIPNAFGPDGLVAYIEHDDLDAAVIVVRRLRLQ